MKPISRRAWLRSSCAAAATPWIARGGDGPPEFSFFVLGDTHFYADPEDISSLDTDSAATTTALVDVLNRLPGTDIPEKAGGGRVLPPLGVIHCGDLIDSGDKHGGDFEAMQRTEWAAYEAAFGLDAGQGKLKYPVYEVHGNHDSPRGGGLAIEALRRRTANRPGVQRRSANGLHYSWNWHGVQFVHLGLIVSADASVARPRHYHGLDSLAFLQEELSRLDGRSPVVITHHLDMLRHAKPVPPADAVLATDWDPADVAAYHRALAGQPIAGIFHGHTHARNIFRWDGSTNPRAAQGIRAFNVDNASHFKSLTQGFCYVECREGVLRVREVTTPDRWETVIWTPQDWRA